MKKEKETNCHRGNSDYTESKDAYDGTLNSVHPDEPLPESARPRKDGPGGE